MTVQGLDSSGVAAGAVRAAVADVTGRCRVHVAVVGGNAANHLPGDEYFSEPGLTWWLSLQARHPGALSVASPRPFRQVRSGGL